MYEDVMFDAIWDSLATTGHADDSGGAQYRRVRQEWEDAGRPLQRLAFIVTHILDVPDPVNNPPAGWISHHRRRALTATGRAR